MVWHKYPTKFLHAALILSFGRQNQALFYDSMAFDDVLELHRPEDNTFLLSFLDFPVVGRIHLREGVPPSQAICRIALRGWTWVYVPGDDSGVASGIDFSANYTADLQASVDGGGGAEFSTTLPGLSDGTFDLWIQVP